MKAGIIIKMLRQLEADGVQFTLQPDGRFLVKPQPEQGTPLFKFLSKNVDRIRFELWLRTWCVTQDEDHLAFVAKVNSVFDNTIVSVRTYEDMKREYCALMHGRSPEIHLTILSRTIAELGEAGLLQEQAWAIRCFVELGEQFELADLEQLAA